MDYSEIAYKIVNIILNVKQGDVISISGEIHNLKKEENPLAEIPFIEELAIAIRKKKAFPVIEISTEKLKQRFFKEMPDEVFSLPLDYYSKWVKAIDAFIDLGWRNNPEIYENLSDEQYQKIQESTNQIWNSINQQRKKLLCLGFPTPALSKYFDVNQEHMKQNYFKGINCDYHALENNSIEILEKIIHSNKLMIRTNRDELHMTIKAETGKIFAGTNREDLVTVLPTGKIEILIKPESLNGAYHAAKIYYKNSTYTNVKINFINGQIINLSTDEKQRGFNVLQSKIMNHQQEIQLVLGTNDQMKMVTGYSLYDECIKNMISIKILTDDSKPILLSNINANLINKENTKITREVD